MRPIDKMCKMDKCIKYIKCNLNQSGQYEPIRAIKTNQGTLSQPGQSKPIRAI